jgi:endonuclease/exonuclease/phosphatase (EEP) superfamily protein YafD
VRVVSWQLRAAGGSPEQLRAALQQADPDLILLQAIDGRIFDVLEDAISDRSWVRQDQYAVGSRWPVRFLGAAAPADNGWRSWARFAVDAPMGMLDVFVAHPHSPRALLRGGLRKGLAGDREEMRALERALREIDETVRHGGALRIVAGDFNVPGGSGLWRGLFPGAADAFAEAGNGYGYTFPLRGRWVPWMRLDRVLTGEGWKATRAELIGRRGWDHAGVLVELERAR